MSTASRDDNFVTTLLAVSSVDGVTPVTLYANPTTHRLLVDLAGGGSGTVQTVAVATANGFAGTSDGNASAPTITLTTSVIGVLYGNGTAMSALTIGSGLSLVGTTLSASGAGSGTVTDVSVVTANGVSGSVATSTTTPAITLTLGAITPTSVSATSFVAATPATDTIAGVFRRNNGSQTANIVEIQTEANALLAGFDKDGKISVPSANVSGLTASEIVLTDASKNLVSAAVATYPSLTELSYVKGVTSGIQSQLNAKGNVSKVGTPVDNQVGVWTGDGTLEGDASLTFDTATNTLTTDVVTVNTGLMPDANDGAYLGQAGTAFSDLFLAEGGVINWDNGDATLTQVGDVVTLAGADLKVSSPGDVTNSVLTTSATQIVYNKGLVLPGIKPVNYPTNTGGIQLAMLESNSNYIYGLPHPTSGVETGLGGTDAIFVLKDATQTLTNKRITKRTGTTTSSATPTINTDNVDEYYITAQTADITSFTTNLSGTATLGQTLFISVIGTAARAITWGASFGNGPVALPTTTVTTTELSVLFKYDGTTWRCYASGSRA
jgi:hypothetical protein